MKHRPDDTPSPAAQSPAVHRAIVVEAPGGSMRATVAYMGQEWELAADRDATPDPVSAFLGALGACFLMSLQVAAKARHINLGRSRIAAHCNERGAVREITLDLRVESDAGEASLEHLVKVAKRGCYIRALLREDLLVHLTVTRL